MDWDRTRLTDRIVPTIAYRGPWGVVMGVFSERVLMPLGISVEPMANDQHVNITLDYVTVADALDQLCELVGYDWSLANDRISFTVADEGARYILPGQLSYSQLRRRDVVFITEVT